MSRPIEPTPRLNTKETVRFLNEVAENVDKPLYQKDTSKVKEAKRIFLEKERRKNVPKVYIVNKSGHDYSDALRYGKDLVYLSEGTLRASRVNSFYRMAAEKMEGSTNMDYLIPTSLPILSAVAAAILARKHGILNLLIFKEGKYVCRRILIDELIKKEGEEDAKD